jgi:hypothetical protein
MLLDQSYTTRNSKMPNDIVIREFYPHLTANATNPHITKADLAAMRQDLAQQNGWLAALCVLNALTCKDVSRI